MQKVAAVNALFLTRDLRTAPDSGAKSGRGSGRSARDPSPRHRRTDGVARHRSGRYAARTIARLGRRAVNPGGESSRRRNRLLPAYSRGSLEALTAVIGSSLSGTQVHRTIRSAAQRTYLERGMFYRRRSSIPSPCRCAKPVNWQRRPMEAAYCRQRHPPAGARNRAARPVSESALRDVAPHLVASYFARVGEHLLAKPRLRHLVSFGFMNLAKPDFPIGQFDCIFCMDVLPRFSLAQRATLLQRLHLYLQPGGYLFLGQGRKTARRRSDLRHLRHTGSCTRCYRKGMAAVAKVGVGDLASALTSADLSG